jgi:hypothetical protein
LDPRINDAALHEITEPVSENNINTSTSSTIGAAEQSSSLAQPTPGLTENSTDPSERREDRSALYTAERVIDYSTTSGYID